MALDILKFAFVAGELSPTLFSRADFEKYDLGLAQALNWTVDYRGGITTRAGTHFTDFVEHDDLPTKFIPFRFAPAAAQTYVLLFGDGYIRFIQGGSYILEADKTITGVSQASPGVVTAASHGFSTGDWIKIFDVAGMPQLNDRIFQVGATTTNTFELLNPLTGASFSTAALSAYTSGGVANRIYTVASPYAAEDLELLRHSQTRDAIYLTHSSYAPRRLLRNGDTDWDLELESFTNTITVPASVTLTDSATGAAGVAFAVTTVDEDGNESLPSRYAFEESMVNYAATAGSMRVTWTGSADAAYYNVYRSIITPVGADVHQGMSLGYVGSTFAPQFTDNNIIPDFSLSPPIEYNPFADSTIISIKVTAGGTGYSKTSTVNITDASGTGALAYPVVNAAGNLLAIILTQGGAGYVSPSISVSGGTGATFSTEVGPASGNFPACNTVFQQRKIYAASENNPLTIWGSRTGRFNNFDASRVVTDDSGYEFELDADDAAPIRHLFPTRAGLLLFTQSAIWQLSAGPNEPVTPTNALAEPQSYGGSSLVPPLPVDVNILYIEGKGTTVRLLSYTDFTKVYSGQDISILSNHLFKQYSIKSWAFASEPSKIVWAVREDGVLLALTLVHEQNVYAWTRVQTKGLVRDVVVVQEGNIDVVYLMVERLLNGRWTKCIEYLDNRNFSHVEDAWCLDAALAAGATYPAASLTPSAASGEDVTFTASAGVFAPGDVGSVIRGGGGKAVVTGYTSSTVVQATILRDIEAVLPEDEAETPLTIEEGEWTLDEPFSSVSGLWHLEGEEVSILADGNVRPPRVVTNGAVSLGVDATRVIVGLPYTCIAQTLPPVSDAKQLQGKRKNVLGVATRLYEARGIQAGPDLDNLYEMKDRTTELPGEPTFLQIGVRFLSLAADFNDEGQTYFVQEYPLPATILGFAAELDVGDDQDNSGW